MPKLPVGRGIRVAQLRRRGGAEVAKPGPSGEDEDSYEDSSGDDDDDDDDGGGDEQIFRDFPNFRNNEIRFPVSLIPRGDLY